MPVLGAVDDGGGGVGLPVVADESEAAEARAVGDEGGAVGAWQDHHGEAGLGVLGVEVEGEEESGAFEEDGLGVVVEGDELWSVGEEAGG